MTFLAIKSRQSIKFLNENFEVLSEINLICKVGRIFNILENFVEIENENLNFEKLDNLQNLFLQEFENKSCKNMIWI